MQQSSEHLAAPSGDVPSAAPRSSPLESGRSELPQVLGLVERLRNGGQPDLADMAHGLMTNLQFAVALLEAMPFIRGTAQVDAMRAAIAKATGGSL